MRTHEEPLLESRMARLDALYEQYCRPRDTTDSSLTAPSRPTTEIPCEFAPGVLRRTARPTQQ